MTDSRGVGTSRPTLHWTRHRPDSNRMDEKAPPRPTALLAELEARAEELRALTASHGASRLRVFGSVSRGEETPDSDIDLLVELPRGYDMFEQRLALSEALERALSRPVDLIPEHELNRHVRARVLAESVTL